jgi:RAD51-like protein 3
MLSDFDDSVLTTAARDVLVVRHNIRTADELLLHSTRLLAPGALPGIATANDAARALAAIAHAVCGAPRTALDEFRSTEGEEEAQTVPTGLPGLDRVLGGGVRVGELTELVGGASAGKTVLCHRLCAHACLSARGTTATALFVDTCGAFSARYLAACIPDGEATTAAVATQDSVARAFIGGVRVVRAFDVDALLAVLERLTEDGDDDDDEFLARLRVVVVDSFTAAFSPVLGAHPLGHALLVRAARLMKRAARQRRLAFVVSN